MKPKILALIILLTQISVGLLPADDFSKVIKSFSGSDGAHPQAGLLLSGNTLYGTTFDGGGRERNAV